ncbi:MAG: Ferredoxin [Syntrophaceae bacterium PtaU1.Bin231]|nr:MAG: Ferredoxin [Syntrophaceae bacterium PtaU1.Bin231]HOG18486.1 4Fe-4S binding protein [Syntrophales bacterium]
MSHHIGETCDGCGACVRMCPTGAVTGAKKTRHAIAAELCIECGACGRICPRGAVTDAFGIPCEAVRRSAWDKPRFDAGRCVSCGICIDACPARCLGLSEALQRERHALPFLAEEKNCLGCGFCVRECPMMAISMEGLKK